MYSVNEYYRYNKTFCKTTRHFQRFETLEEATAFADDVYPEIGSIPESEAVFVGVLDEDTGIVVYTQPAEPFAKAQDAGMTTKSLQARWEQVWQPYGVGRASEDVFYELEAAYTAPDRHYHTLSHVADCLRLLDSCREEAQDAAAIELALWFHDAVYDTHAADNEEQSAHWAVRAMGDGGSAAAVRRLILATKHGASVSAERDDLLIADIDLAILGADEATFWAYENAIRREYHWVAEDVYRSKRAEILRRFLQRERLYQTPRFHEKYDAAARVNLEASIRRLMP